MSLHAAFSKKLSVFALVPTLQCMGTSFLRLTPTRGGLFTSAFSLALYGVALALIFLNNAAPSSFSFTPTSLSLLVAGAAFAFVFGFPSGATRLIASTVATAEAPGLRQLPCLLNTGLLMVCLSLFSKVFGYHLLTFAPAHPEASAFLVVAFQSLVALLIELALLALSAFTKPRQA